MQNNPSIPIVLYRRMSSVLGALAAPLLPEPLSGVKMVAPSELVEEAVPLVEVAVAVLLVLLAGEGSSAPQGWSCRQAEEQELELPQAATHC